MTGVALTARREMDRTGLGLLAGGHLCADLCQGAVPAMLPFLVQQRHLSYAAAAGLVLAQTISSSLVQPVFGRLSDRRPMPWLLPVGTGLAGLGLGVASLAPTYTLAWLAVAVSGLGIAAFHPEGARYANYVSGERRATGMSVFGVGGTAGFALGPVLATPLLLAAGLDGGWALALPGVLMAVALTAVLPRLRRAAPTGEAKKQARAETGADRWGPFTRLTGVLLCRSIVFYALNTFIPLYWIAVLHQSKVVGGLALSLMLVCGAAGNLLGGQLGDRFSRRGVVLLAMVLTAPLLLGLALSAQAPLATALLVPLALAMWLPASLLVVLGQEYLPNSMGTASGVTLGLSVSVGGIVTPFLGAAGDHLGLRPVLFLLVLLPVVGAALAFSLPRSRPSATA